MAFVKLDCGILNSTLWVEREPRDVFITALLMAAPFEAINPMHQIKVNTIEETGFVVPPGWYGFVQAAGPGIVRMSMADPVLGMQALVRLGEPDPESRSSEFEGRRLVRVDGGYLVLNFMKYRDKDNTASVRAQRYRDRKKQAAIASTSRRDVHPVTRDSSCGVTIAEAEAEAEKEKEKAPTVLVALSDAYRVPDCPFQDLLDAYHVGCPSLPRVRIVTGQRQKLARDRWVQVCADEKWSKAEALEWFKTFFSGIVERSDFLAGRTGRGRTWRADFQWLMTAGNFAKVVEGRYAKEAA